MRLVPAGVSFIGTILTGSTKGGATFMDAGSLVELRPAIRTVAFCLRHATQQAPSGVTNNKGRVVLVFCLCIFIFKREHSKVPPKTARADQARAVFPRGPGAQLTTQTQLLSDGGSGSGSGIVYYIYSVRVYL
jgi:hypothetical protein